MLLLVAVFRTSELGIDKCRTSVTGCVQISHPNYLNQQTMPYYRVLPPILDQAIPTVIQQTVASVAMQSTSDKLRTTQTSPRQYWLIPGLIACFACVTLGLFFLT
ncbi:hypothetical protein [Undibacterium flavidum]|uniref:Uncharacterized protein n=1 Tax=Undibacterium flavidum TaxID=2762297 RepID=A0ABR6YC13_9BURK|nr:hypothetical protein [Undibacterium flavidum]MBC3874087.1 hypothetical protein [Undibacterium flavidum]